MGGSRVSDRRVGADYGRMEGKAKNTLMGEGSRHTEGVKYF